MKSGLRMFQLKDHQRRCPDELAQFLRRVIARGRAGLAFYEQTGRPYRQVHALPGLPYVCVRVPTGGGKTVLADHAVGITARELLRQDRCLVLWLAPTKQIVEQTLKALRDKRHSYRDRHAVRRRKPFASRSCVSSNSIARPVARTLKPNRSRI